jgi:hypothetical protein
MVIGFHNWNRAAYGNGTWIAVGNKGYISVSIDNGALWTGHIVGSHDWHGIAYDGKGTWVAASSCNCNDRSTVIATSTDDGATWTIWGAQRTVPHFCTGIAYGNGVWVAVGNHGKIATSANVIDWTIQGVEQCLHGAVEQDKQYYNGGYHTIAHSYYWYGIAYGNGLFAAIGEHFQHIRGYNPTRHEYTGKDSDISAVGYIATSTDGRNWTIHSMHKGYTPILHKGRYPPFVPWSIAYGNNRFIVVNGNEFSDIITCTNGTDCTTQRIGTKKWNKVAYGGNRWVVGCDNSIATSTDGTNWTI